MKRNILFMILTSLIIIIGLSGCTNIDIDNNLDMNKNRFIGTWELQSFEGSDPNDTTTYTFYENNTFLSVFDDYDGYKHEGRGDYYLNKGSICMDTHPHGAITDNDSYCYDYRFSNNYTILTLTNSSLPDVTLLKLE